MSVSDIKSEVAALLEQRRGENSLAPSSSGSLAAFFKPQILLPVLGVGLLGWLVFKPPTRIITAADTGNAQIDQAMGMLQQQQDINRELLQGQQELNAQMIQAQSKAKAVQPNINCWFSIVCPSGSGQSQPNQDFAVMGDGIRTAIVDPTRVMPQLQQPAPVQPQSQPVTALPNYYAQVQQVTAPQVDADEQEYRRLSELLVSDPQSFYNTAWQWAAAINSNEPTAVGLRRIFAEVPETRVY